MQERRRKKEPFLLAHWHGDEAVLMSLIGKYKLAIITSTSKDGEMMNSIIHLLGGVTSRGSSNDRAVGGLKGLLRYVKQGYSSSFAVDGPRGPIYKVKPGVFEVSRLSHLPIYYAGVAVDRCWRFERAWNKAYFPKPFAKIIIQWNGPIGPVSKEQDPRSSELASNLENALQQEREECFKKLRALS